MSDLKDIKLRAHGITQSYILKSTTTQNPSIGKKKRKRRRKHELAPHLREYLTENVSKNG